MMEAKKKQLVHLALLTAGILLIFTEYQLYEKQEKANLDIGKGLPCSTTNCVGDVRIRTKGILVLCRSIYSVEYSKCGKFNKYLLQKVDILKPKPCPSRHICLQNVASFFYEFTKGSEWQNNEWSRAGLLPWLFSD